MTQRRREKRGERKEKRGRKKETAEHRGETRRPPLSSFLSPLSCGFTVPCFFATIPLMETRSVSLGELLGAYREHLSSYDWFILFLGAFLLISQSGLCLWARAVLLRPKGELRFLKEMSLKLFERFCASLVELFTLLGLLGTVFSLLFTFTQMQEGEPGEILRSFAPAFTATISGLVCAIANKLVYDTALSPLMESLLEANPEAKP
jgi:MotA/TolQ/ExbB proton channel family